MTEAFYLSTNPTCTDVNLNGVFSIFGTFALSGPSDCGGFCQV